MIRRSFAIALVSISLVVGAALPGSASPRVPRFVAKGPFERTASVARAVAGDGFAISRKDGNDVKGPLDLASMEITRGKKNDSIVFSTHGAVSNKAIDPNNGNFAILIDTNDNRKYDYAQYVFFAAGKPRGLLVNLPSKVVDRTAPTSRANARTFRTVIQRSKIHSPGTYRFAVVSYFQSAPCSGRRPCIDTIPNRFPLFPLDHRAPSASLVDLPIYSTDVSDTLEFDVSLNVSDDKFGTGIQEWVLESSESGGPWTLVDSGTTKGEHGTPFAGIQGGVYDFRVRAIDKQENERISAVGRTYVPIDDSSAGLTFSSGDWSDDPNGSAFLGTDKLSTVVSSPADGVTVTGSFTGTSICFIGGDPLADGGASVEIDSVSSFNFDQDPNPGRGRVSCSPAVTPGVHTFLLTVDRDIVSFDGYVAVP